MPEILRQQYQLVQDMRGVLFDWCARMEPSHFVAPVPAFHNKCIRDTLIHITHASVFWIGHFSLRSNHPYAPEDACQTVAHVAAVYDQVDGMMNEFLKVYGDDPLQMITGEVRKKTATFPALQLFTHAVTHEFHHKGQILTMGRYHGYAPVDTDIIRL